MKSKKTIIVLVIIALIITITSIVATILIINNNKSKEVNENNGLDANTINENEEEIISVLKDMDTYLNNYKLELNDELSIMKNMMFLFTTGIDTKIRTLKEYVSQIYEVRKTTNNGVTTYYIDAELIDKDDVLLKKRTIIKFLNNEIVSMNLNLGDINVLSKHFSDGDTLTSYTMLKYVYNDTFNSVTEQINTEWQNATIIENVNYQKIWNNLYGDDENGEQ